MICTDDLSSCHTKCLQQSLALAFSSISHQSRHLLAGPRKARKGKWIRLSPLRPDSCISLRMILIWLRLYTQPVASALTRFWKPSSPHKNLSETSCQPSGLNLSTSLTTCMLRHFPDSKSLLTKCQCSPNMCFQLSQSPSSLPSPTDTSHVCPIALWIFAWTFALSDRRRLWCHSLKDGTNQSQLTPLLSHPHLCS